MKRKLGLLAVCVLLAFPGAAWAQSSVEGYAGPGGSAQSAVEGDGASSRSGGSHAGNEEAGSGALPFTGLDLGLIGAGGLLLALAGLAMRRLAQAPASG